MRPVTLLLALTLEGKDNSSSQVLAGCGATTDRVLEALSAVRGSQRVTDQNPEDKYEALARYGRDLTTLAPQDKLDPVIRRDDADRPARPGR